MNLARVSIKVFITILCFSVFGIAFAGNENYRNDTNKTKPSVSLTKICTHQSKDPDYYGFCDKGYVLKTEKFADGRVEDSIFMDGIEGYGWTHTATKKLKDNISLFSLSCGTGCGANILVGTNGKEQAFDYWFAYDALSECGLEYDNDKNLWAARPFFSHSVFELEQTYNGNESASMPGYTIEADNEGGFIATSHFSDEVNYIYNPCNR